MSLFFAISSMTRGFKKYFKGDVSCILCKGGSVKQRNLLACPVLLTQLCSAEEEVARMVDFDDMYKGMEEQSNFCLILEHILRIREGLRRAVYQWT